MSVGLSRWRYYVRLILTMIVLAMLASVSSSPSSRLQAAAPSQIEHISAITGDVSAFTVAIQNNMAYIGGNKSFTIADVSQPDKQPITKGKTTLFGRAQAIAVAQQTAYVVVDKQLQVVDVQDPNAPRVLAQSALVSLPSSIRALAVAGHYLYLAAEQAGLIIIDITNPMALSIVATVAPSDTLASVISVAVSGKTAFVQDASKSVIGFDISNPNTPLRTKQVLPNHSLLTVTDQVLYVYDNINRMVQVIDLTAATPATVIGKLAVDNGIVYGAIIQKQTLFIQQTGGISLIDITNPRQLALLGTFTAVPPVVEIDPWPGYVHCGLAVNNNRMYVITSFDNMHAQSQCGRTDILLPSDATRTIQQDKGVTVHALRIVDISNLREPRQTDIYNDNAGAQYFAGITVDGTQMFTSGVSGPDIGIITPVQRDATGQLHLQQSVTLNETISQMALSNGRLFVKTNKQFAVFDANALSTTPIYSYKPANTAVTIGDFVVRGSLVYIGEQTPAGNTYDLRVIDFSQPQNPKDLGRITIGKGFSIALSNSYAYLASKADDGITITTVDITNPADLHVTNSVTTNALGELYSISAAANNQFLFVSGNYTDNDQSKLLAYDLLDASHPQLRTITNTNRLLAPIKLINDMLYVVDTQLTVYSAANPNDLKVLATAPQSGAFEVVGRNIFVAGTSLDYLRYTGPIINGQVTHPNGQPYKGVVINSSAGHRASSNDQGLYTLGGLPSGSLTITPTLEGFRFAPATHSLAVAQGDYQLTSVVLTKPVTATVEADKDTSINFNDTQGLPTSIIMPQGVATVGSTVALTPTIAVAPRGQGFAGHAFEISFTSNTAEQNSPSPIMVKTSYSAADIHMISDKNKLALYFKSIDGWVPAQQTCAPAADPVLDLAAGTLEVKVCSMGTYALFGPSQQVFVPLIAQSKW